MDLPYHDYLPLHLLAGCFNNSSTTYKFYWFLTVLRRVETGDTTIQKRDLFTEMVSHAWYTVNYFTVSFGKQDKLQAAIEQLKALEQLTIDADRRFIFQRLAASENKQTLRQLRYFNGEVPHRFLSPWFRAADSQAFYTASQGFDNQCLYALYADRIEINPVWVDYLKRHAGILREFCCWNLAVYLQAKNPNVPDIPNKLIKLPIRKAVTEQRKFWDIVIGELGSVDCIYTNTKLVIGDYVVEHFLPYAFFPHALMWNLIPPDGLSIVPKVINCLPLKTTLSRTLTYNYLRWRSYSIKHLNINFWKTILRLYLMFSYLNGRGYWSKYSRWRPSLKITAFNF